LSENKNVEKNELILAESRTMRDELVFKDDVLDKIKFVIAIPGTSEATIDLAANYYEVDKDAIESVIRRHRNEFNDYGEMRILKGKLLTEFKTLRQADGSFKGINSLTLFSRRGLLRIGMLLTESSVAKTIRHYLLNIEEISTKEQISWAVERERARQERVQLTQAIKDFYEGTMKKGQAYSVITDMVYKVLFDTNAQGLRHMHGIEDTKATPRDFMSTDDLRKIVSAEKTVASLLLLGKGKREIEAELNKNKDKFLLRS
jgi:hypothetical protein